MTTPSAAVMTRRTTIELAGAPAIPWGISTPRRPRVLYITRHYEANRLVRVVVTANSHTDAPGRTWDSTPPRGIGANLTDLPEYLRTVVASFEPDLLPWTEYPTREVTHG